MQWTNELDAKLVEIHGSMSIKAAAQAMGTTPASIRARVTRLGLAKRECWTLEEEEVLRAAYLSAGEAGVIDLFSLSAVFGRSRANISRKARQLGLPTSQSRKKVAARKVRERKHESKEDLSKAISSRMRRYLKEFGHPRGMQGKKHSKQSLEKIAEASTRMNAARTEEMKAAYSLKAAKTKMLNGTYAMPRHKTTWKAGQRVIGGLSKFFRSRWEANYARYLQSIKERGEILDWEHEPEAFFFEGDSSGGATYLPDFKVTNLSGSIEYHEVKGWMDERSKVKLEKMAKHYPGVDLVLVDSKAYQNLCKVCAGRIEGWE